jgi:DNA polymerase IIIc chi subunit
VGIAPDLASLSLYYKEEAKRSGERRAEREQVRREKWKMRDENKLPHKMQDHDQRPRTPLMLLLF